ncbi:MAG: hypothetical protein ONB46_20570 [candidate division KSB1 bacterium]|nr:hypothetical protein [candidate division KSB1 bacterium]MDZ7368250.1 hypothetical protein [candidate division KSB1 bacterium]MDZ7406768.1 hypothetical protein [candidate division KSB1 bacterium]
MRTPRFSQWIALAAVSIVASWSVRQPALWAADNKPVTVQIFYSSDALGYHDPCG